MRAVRGAFALILLITSPAFADCEVQGRASLDRLRVRVAGVGIRTFAIEGLPVAVRAGSGGHSRDVRVLGPLAFAARTDARVPWTFVREGPVAEGLLWWTPASQIENAREIGDEIELRIRLADGVSLDRLRMPCNAIRLGAARPSASAPPSYPPGPQFAVRRSETWIWSEPGGQGSRARIDVRTTLPEPFVELGRNRGWVEVATSFAETGAVVRGWVREQDLMLLAPGADSEPDAPPIPQQSAGSCNYTPRRNEYVGTARVEGGTLVRDRADGVAWAEVPHDADVRIAWRHGDAWAQIVEVRGLRSSDRSCPFVLTNAWVPRRSIRLQGE
jgi:hypothetical protein